MIRLFVVDFADVPPETVTKWIDCLSVAEKRRLTRMTSSKRQTEFIVGHTVARHFITRLFGCSFNSLVLKRTRAGALTVGGVSDCYVCLSHSHGRVAVAISNQPVGVDMEYRRDRTDYQAVLERIGSDKTVQPTKDGFYQAWTRFEARYKLASVAGDVPAPSYQDLVVDAYQISLSTAEPDTVDCQQVHLTDSLP